MMYKIVVRAKYSLRAYIFDNKDEAEKEREWMIRHGYKVTEVEAIRTTSYMHSIPESDKKFLK